MRQSHPSSQRIRFCRDGGGLSVQRPVCAEPDDRCADTCLHPSCAAAFSVDDGETERLVIVVEADGRVLRDAGENALQERILLAVHDGQRLWPDEVVVVRRGVLPRTTGGKVRRRACRELYLGDALKVVRRWRSPVVACP